MLWEVSGEGAKEVATLTHPARDQARIAQLLEPSGEVAASDQVHESVRAGGDQRHVRVRAREVHGRQRYPEPCEIARQGDPEAPAWLAGDERGRLSARSFERTPRARQARSASAKVSFRVVHTARPTPSRNSRD
jgi:hypothetical protein